MRWVNAWAGVALGATVLLAVCLPPMSALAFLEQALLFSMVAAGAVVDARRRIIPDAVWVGIVLLHLTFICAYAAVDGLSPGTMLVEAALSGFVLGGGLLAFTLAFETLTGAEQALGGGDIKLVFALGFALGLGRGALALMLACAVFALYAGLLGRQRAYPFGPALAVGTCLVFLA